MYHHMDSLLYLAMPVTVPSQPGAYTTEIGAHPPSDRILRAGTPIRIKTIRNTGLVSFVPVQDTGERCVQSCSIAVSLDPDSARGPFFEEVFTTENPLSDLDASSLRDIQQHRVVEGMTSEQVVFAMGPPQEQGDTSHVFYRDSQTRYEGEGTHYWEYATRRVYFAGDLVIDVTEDAEPIIEIDFDSRCD